MSGNTLFHNPADPKHAVLLCQHAKQCDNSTQAFTDISWQVWDMSAYQEGDILRRISAIESYSKRYFCFSKGLVSYCYTFYLLWYNGILLPSSAVRKLPELFSFLTHHSKRCIYRHLPSYMIPNLCHQLSMMYTFTEITYKKKAAVTDFSGHMGRSKVDYILKTLYLTRLHV